MNHPANKGMTLIEVILYTALLGSVLASLLTIAYPLLIGAERMAATSRAEGETLFVIRKITWALRVADDIEEPLAGATSSVLRLDTGAEEITFSEGTDEVLFEQGAIYPLTSSRTLVKNITFSHHAPVGEMPRYIEVSFEINDHPVGPIKIYAYF